MICVSSYFFWLLYLSDLLKVLRRVISGTGYMLLYSEGPDRTSKYIWSISHDMSIYWICDLVDSKICSIAYGGWTEDRIPPYNPIHLYLFIITFPMKTRAGYTSGCHGQRWSWHRQPHPSGLTISFWGCGGNLYWYGIVHLYSFISCIIRVIIWILYCY
jgi:hypothetical protein